MYRDYPILQQCKTKEDIAAVMLQHHIPAAPVVPMVKKVASKREQNKLACYAEREQARRNGKSTQTGCAKAKPTTTAQQLELPLVW